MEVSSKPDIYTAGKGTFFDDMLNQLDAKNSFSDINGWKSVSKESIIKHNPDILISTEGKSKSDYIKMIKNVVASIRLMLLKIHELNQLMETRFRPGPRIDEGLKELRMSFIKIIVQKSVVFQTLTF